jgi:hypothetical protein
LPPIVTQIAIDEQKQANEIQIANDGLNIVG